jgi:hypothetical protein
MSTKCPLARKVVKTSIEIITNIQRLFKEGFRNFSWNEVKTTILIMENCQLWLWQDAP